MIGRTTKAIVLSAALLVLLTAGAAVAAAGPDVCAKANARLAATGKGDRDHDGLSNCEERRVLGTDPGNWDSDDDGVADGKEMKEGTAPTDSDSDDDGVGDGDECDHGTDPMDGDSDHDGEGDGDDPDPKGDLESKIESTLQALTCPTDTADGSLTLLGIVVVLTPMTEFEHPGSCADLAALFALGESLHVEVKVEGDATTALVARQVEVENGDQGDGDHGDHDDGDSGDGDDGEGD